jgi:hypothetical protein
MESSEILSAFVDGETVDADALAAALSAPGGRETLIDFVRLREAVDEDERPSEPFVRRMRKRLAGARWDTGRAVRFAAAAAIAALAVVGAADLIRGTRARPSADEPPPVARVIRFEPGVDWYPVERER